jgi:tricorn protease
VILRRSIDRRFVVQVRLASPLVVLSVVCSLTSASATAADSIRLANSPALSPDGSTLVFSWTGDLWSVPSVGGEAKRLTFHPGRDTEPFYSPDGKEIAFISDRDGSTQVYVMPASGGAPKQLTFHTAGHALAGWFPDGQSLLINAARDLHWKPGNHSFFQVRRDERSPEKLLFDDYGRSGSISPDGKKLLFTREGPAWWRKGYKGSQASQIWLYDLDKKSFDKMLAPDTGALWPLWAPDGKGFYYVGVSKGAFNLKQHSFDKSVDVFLSEFDDDSVVFPCLSRDGSTLVFRHLFDFYRLDLKNGGSPVKIDIKCSADSTTSTTDRRTLTNATSVAFSKDGLEVAFIAGGDLWVMDTELMEPKPITQTPDEESAPVFSPDGESIVFVSDKDGQSDIWRASRADAKKFWWQNSEFKLDRLTQDVDVESLLKYSPDGSKIAFVRSRGDLWIMGPDGKDAKRVLAHWSAPDFDWSPDGKWLVYSQSDSEFNQDIWVAPIDGSSKPFNLSKHPDNEDNPVWSPDGKIIAFTGRRVDTEVDIYFVYLRAEDDQTDRRERTIEKAVDKITKARAKKARPGGSAAGKKADSDAAKDDKTDVAKSDAKTDDLKSDEPRSSAPPKVVIDFDRIHERLRRVAIPDSRESGLFWSPDSKKLAFTSTIDGKRGVYTIEPPDDLKPKLLSTQSIGQARWIETGNQIVGLSAPAAPVTGEDAEPIFQDAAPASLSVAGKETTYRVRALQSVDLPKRYRAAFDLCWRTMRDRFYDERLGNRNWDEIRRKYADMAEQSPDIDTFATVVSLMLGELNGSHLGFTPRGRGPAEPPGAGASPSPGGNWNAVTGHLGARFAADDKGPGLLVRDVIPDSPADHKKSRIQSGERVMTIGGVAVDPGFDLTRVLNGPLDRDVRLSVRNAEGQDREVIIRPISYFAVHSLLYDKWCKDNRKAVDAASKGTLGYLHIRGMSMPSLYKFEEELYSAGSGKDGLIVDVRENGGGSTADLLLTILTQPTHAITVPRGGGPGYPQDRKVFASWDKPIVVLCNQNSFSNAEIFSHAIKTLKRGQLVGVPTAGGVISTGAAAIMDVGMLRLPTRGWFLLNDGEDMELNGALPDFIVWPLPGDMAQGKDAQLAKGVEVLMADVAEAKARPKPKLRKATER